MSSEAPERQTNIGAAGRGPRKVAAALTSAGLSAATAVVTEVPGARGTRQRARTPGRYSSYVGRLDERDRPRSLQTVWIGIAVPPMETMGRTSLINPKTRGF